MRIFLISLSITLSGCSSPENFEVVGVWQMTNLEHPISKYYEVIITDSTYTVFSEIGLRYVADYNIARDNVMNQYIRDIEISNVRVIDTIQFNFLIKNDSLILSNFENPKNRSSWFKIGNIEQLDIVNCSDDYSRYAADFKKRYTEVILTQMPDSSSQRVLRYFESNWNVEN